MAAVEIKYTQLFIDNEFVDAESGKKFPTYDPATERTIAHVSEGDKTDVDKAVKAARKAFELGSEWRSLDASARGALMMKFASLLKRDVEYLASLETLNNGKPYKEAIMDINYSAACIEYYAGWCDKICGKTIPADGPVFTYTKHEPIGVCAQIIPWNYPIMMIAWKFGPALACGNTIVLKPAEQTPLTALYIGSLIKEAGFPAGVVNIVPGYGPTAGAALSLHNDVDKIAFTGSTEIGRLIQQMSGQSNLKRVSLELGGKSPFVVFNVNDADLEAAAGFACASIFGNQGQSCCASSRIFVHEDVYEKFLEKVKNIASKLVVGDPYADETTQGAIVSDEQFQKILGYIESGKNQGARLVEGGCRVGNKGYFVRPTVFGDVKDDMKIAKEEIFGPVMSVIKFSSVQEAVKRANATTYGLAAGVFCNDMDTVLTMVNSLQAGSVWVNCYEYITAQTPFGGFKQSGFGRELGEYGLHEYCEIKTVTIKFNSKL